MLRLRSGSALSKSMAMVRPNPRHSGHAPNGLLKLNKPGLGGGGSMSQGGQCQPVEKGNSDCRLPTADRDEVRRSALAKATAGRASFSAIGTTFSFPLP